MVIILNSNIMRNADCFISKMEVEPEIEWVGKDKIRVDSSTYKIRSNLEHRYLLNEIWVTNLGYCWLIYIINFGCVCSRFFLHIE